MRKLLILLLATVLIAYGCKKSEQARYTILGDYTPYTGFIEKMNGNVQQVTEKIYWTVADGDTIKKGNPVTIHERDSLKWYYDHEANFDSVGNLLSCNYFDENNKIVGSWQFTKENHILVSAKWTWKDTIRENQQLTCNDKGIIIGVKAYDAIADTLTYTFTVDYNKTGDTVLYLGYNSKGILDLKVPNIYNDKGQFISWETYDKDGAFTGSNKVLYNEKGKLSEVTFFDKDKKATGTFTRTYPEYDAKGNWIKAISKDDKGNTVISERTYLYYE